MLEKHHAVGDILRTFPELRKPWDPSCPTPDEGVIGQLDIMRFVQFVTEELYERENFRQVDVVFEHMEELLKEGTAEVRELVALRFLETLGTVASFKPYGCDVFIRFLYPESRRLWDRLEAAWNLNLNDCGVLEGEVLVWRVVRENLGQVSTAAKPAGLALP